MNPEPLGRPAKRKDTVTKRGPGRPPKQHKTEEVKRGPGRPKKGKEAVQDDEFCAKRKLAHEKYGKVLSNLEIDLLNIKRVLLLGDGGDKKVQGKAEPNKYWCSYQGTWETAAYFNKLSENIYSEFENFRVDVSAMTSLMSPPFSVSEDKKVFEKVFRREYVLKEGKVMAEGKVICYDPKDDNFVLKYKYNDTVWFEVEQWSDLYVAMD